jgi:hypothetical protein
MEGEGASPFWRLEERTRRGKNGEDALPFLDKQWPLERLPELQDRIFNDGSRRRSLGRVGMAHVDRRLPAWIPATAAYGSGRWWIGWRLPRLIGSGDRQLESVG